MIGHRVVLQPTRVSNDNAYAEALFRAAKYCPLWPERPFDTLDDARHWVLDFVSWYNDEHRHSGVKYVTLGLWRRGEAAALLALRTAVYQAAHKRHPQRWSTDIRNRTLKNTATLNPERARVQRKEDRRAACLTIEATLP